MAGNSQRRGAIRKSKKGATTGSGGKIRRGLEGKGPTPKAEDREYHPAHKRKVAAERQAATAPQRSHSGPPKQLRRSSTANARSDREIVGGRNSVLEALRYGIPVSAAYLAQRIDTDQRIREILTLLRTAGIPLLEVTKSELDRMTDGAVHQGVAIQVPVYEYAHPDELLDIASDAHEPPLIVALDGITDPRNLGAVLRSAGAFGAHGVVVPQRRSVGLTASAWKVSAGAAARVRVAQASNLNRALESYQRQGMFVVGLAADGDAVIGDLPAVSEPLVLVTGSEGKGLSRMVREHCDVIASIPIAASTESLNAGVATGIALYEIDKQRVAAGSVVR